MTTLIMAMDRASVRSRDANGYLHVEISNISKANVCPYYGQEIPGWQDLGLEADEVYYLYRDPEELARAADTFNNVPLLSEHVPVIPEEGLPESLIIGSTGTDAEFVYPHLRNSLVVWSVEAQDGIEAERKRELSCGYRYTPDMTAGVSPEGLRFDGVMRKIMGNHVALVIEGRAGPDVMVGDEVMKLKSRTALMISGALQAHIRPLLAKDAKVDIAPALAEVDAKAMAADGALKKLASKIAKLVKPHLAADKAIDADALSGIIAAVQPLALDEDCIEEKQAADEDEDEDEDKQAADESDDEDDKDDQAADEDGDDDEDDKPAMDAAAVRKMVRAAETRGAKRQAAIEIAKSEVAPFVGEVLGHDSAESIYKLALDQAEIDLKGVPTTAYRAMVKMLPKPGGAIAQDRKFAPSGSKLAAMFPSIPTMIRS
ncbi:MAG: DUF2213 domain-containing protein [Sphingomonadales bacterium]|nr:DUF2213 domain-containing protein [Sphingomonadales bacterium]